MAATDSLVSLCIPARYGSSRFPGKPLAFLAGKPLIQHVFEAVQQVPGVGQIMVITDHESIEQCVQEFRGGSLSGQGSLPNRNGSCRKSGASIEI